MRKFNRSMALCTLAGLACIASSITLMMSILVKDPFTIICINAVCLGLYLWSYDFLVRNGHPVARRIVAHPWVSNALQFIAILILPTGLLLALFYPDWGFQTIIIMLSASIIFSSIERTHRRYQFR